MLQYYELPFVIILILECETSTQYFLNTEAFVQKAVHHATTQIIFR